MAWEDPDALLRMKLGREEYVQRMLTSVVLATTYPRWNTKSSPSQSGVQFLRSLYRLAFDSELLGSLEFVDEFELLGDDDGEANGAPDYAVFAQSTLWIIELKTEAASHRKDQLPLYARLARKNYPGIRVVVTYITSPMARISLIDEASDVPFRHLHWSEVSELITGQWGDSPAVQEQLLATALAREIRGLDAPARTFRQVADSIRGAMVAGAGVQITGDQVAIPCETDGLQELHELRGRIADAMRRSEDTNRVRPWIWRAESSGGVALTPLGEQVGYEIRLSRYKRSLD